MLYREGMIAEVDATMVQVMQRKYRKKRLMTSDDKIRLAKYHAEQKADP